MLKSKLILIIIPLFFSCSENIKTTQKPLNVVWISCEDMGPILGSYGNDIVKTPNLDKLASEGVRYTNAYSAGIQFNASQDLTFALLNKFVGNQYSIPKEFQLDNL